MTDDAQQSSGSGEKDSRPAPLRHLLAVLVGAATGLVFYGVYLLAINLFT